MYVYMIVSKFRLLNTLLTHEGLFWLKILVNTNSLWKTIIINQYTGVKNEVSHDLKKRKTTQDQFKKYFRKRNSIGLVFSLYLYKYNKKPRR